MKNDDIDITEEEVRFATKIKDCVDKEELALEKTKKDICLREEQIKKLSIENKIRENKMIDRTVFDRAIGESYGECKKYMESIPKKMMSSLVPSILEDVRKGIPDTVITKKATNRMDKLIVKALGKIASVHVAMALAEQQQKEEAKNAETPDTPTSSKRAKTSRNANRVSMGK